MEGVEGGAKIFVIRRLKMEKKINLIDLINRRPPCERAQNWKSGDGKYVFGKDADETIKIILRRVGESKGSINLKIKSEFIWNVRIVIFIH